MRKGFIYSILRKNLSLLLSIILLSLMVAFINIYFRNMERYLIDFVLAKNLEGFKRVFLTVLLISIVRIFLEYVKAFNLGKFAEKYMNELRLDIGKKLTKVNLEFIEKRATGDFISNLSNDLSLIQNFLNSSLGDIFYQPFVFIFGVILAFQISWKLTLFTFVIIPICIYLSIIISKPVEKYTKKQQDEYGNVNTLVQDTLSGITVIKAFNLKSEMVSLFDEKIKRAFKEGLRSARFEVILDPMKEIISLSPFIMMFLFGGRLVISGEISVGGIMAFIGLINIFIAPMNVLPNIINSYRKAKAALERIWEILSTEEERSGIINEYDPDCPYVVEFENVSFSYDGADYILKDVSFKIKKGEKVAIVGESGGGKSTIVKLILGLYKPTKGHIKVLGIDINEWNLSSLRGRISVANQDVYLFPESVEENIRYGNYNVDNKKIEEVSKKVLAYDFIIFDLGGFDKEIGERALKISGGERQRIALARFLLKEADIFIMDEATSALDSDTEAQIQETLFEELKDKTLIVIAHRYSSIKFVDRILVIEDGKIVEDGTHEYLLKKKGVYYKLYSKQLGEVELGV